MEKEKTREKDKEFDGYSKIAGSIIVGSLIIALSNLISGGALPVKGLTLTNTSPSVPQGSVAPAAVAESTGPVTVDVDDDPMIGDKNAPVTLIEFSDYECPFCKRHFEITYSDLKKEYIDTGKVKLVYRDLPLPFHDPMATTEAIAANCAREQGGDVTYFKYHDELFKRTKSNGNGLAIADLYTIASDLGLNSNNLKNCVEAKKYADEVANDLSEGNKAGATGTPSFFIGKSTGNGQIEGTILVGAQPLSAFKTMIDELLK